MSLARSRHVTWVTTPLLTLAFFALWKGYVSAFDVSPFILPPPERVFFALIELLQEDGIGDEILVTLTETLLGFGIAILVGVGLGVVLGKVAWLERTLNPFVVATQVVPKIALVPLFILWFGFGIASKVIISAVLAFFPILTNTLAGIKSIDRSHHDVMTSLNASRWDKFRNLELPSSLPYILTGMEVGIVLATIGAVVGEYLGGSSGLGHLAVETLAAFEVDKLFAVIVLLTLMGFLLYVAVLGLRRVLVPWHESVQRDASEQI
ncbi:MAG: ABC transporter permease [Burkholderiales bacterium]|nr:MAG: ABC transporter permease [Burkholderiales bacterium]